VLFEHNRRKFTPPSQSGILLFSFFCHSAGVGKVIRDNRVSGLLHTRLSILVRCKRAAKRTWWSRIYITSARMSLSAPLTIYYSYNKCLFLASCSHLDAISWNWMLRNVRGPEALVSPLSLFTGGKGMSLTFAFRIFHPTILNSIVAKIVFNFRPWRTWLGLTRILVLGGRSDFVYASLT